MPRTHNASKRHPARKRNLAWLWGGLAALLLLVAGLAIFQPGAAPVSPTATPASIQLLTAAQVQQKQADGVFILDVRTQEEWNEGHIQGSRLIPLDELPDRLSELPKDAEIVAVCRSGHRSQQAVALLQQAGFTKLASLNGGLLAWTEAGYPLEK